MRLALVLIFCFFACNAVENFEAPIEAGLQCGDALDNDGNGLFDCEEAGCALEVVCEPAVFSCGDGVAEDGESCDDGNADERDACLSSCRAARCGDGFVQTGAEECDDANQSDNDACTNTCTIAVCGDGLVNGGVEQCDDANLINTDGCDDQCRAL